MVLYKISSIRTHTMILFSRPQTIVDNVFGQIKKKKRYFFSLSALREFPGQSGERKSKTWFQGAHELRRQSWEFKEKNVAGDYNTDFCESRYSQRALHIWIESEYWSIQVFQKTKKNVEEHCPVSHTRLRKCLSHQSDQANLTIYMTVDRILRKI